MHPSQEHVALCTIELIAEGHAARCPGDECAFWDRGCVLTRAELELDGRPEVARLLLDLRGALEAGRSVELERARATAQALADIVGLPVTTDPALRETFAGTWQGLTRDEIIEAPVAAAAAGAIPLGLRAGMAALGVATGFLLITIALLLLGKL